MRSPNSTWDALKILTAPVFQGKDDYTMLWRKPYFSNTPCCVNVFLLISVRHIFLLSFQFVHLFFSCRVRRPLENSFCMLIIQYGLFIVDLINSIPVPHDQLDDKELASTKFGTFTFFFSSNKQKKFSSHSE